MSILVESGDKVGLPLDLARLSRAPLVEGELAGYGVKDITTALNLIEHDPDFMKKGKQRYLLNLVEYQMPVWKKLLGAVAVAVVIAAIVTWALFVSNHLMSFPQGFLKLFHNIDPLSIVLGVGIPVLLLEGGIIVISRALSTREALLGAHKLRIVHYVDTEGRKRSSLLRPGDELPGGTEHQVIEVDKPDAEAPARSTFIGKDDDMVTVLLTAQFEKEGKPFTHFSAGFLDRSTLDICGKALVYHTKDCGNHYVVAFADGLLATPIQLIGTIVYHLFRAVIVPFYVLVQLLREHYREYKHGGELPPEQYLFPKERRFKASDIFLQSWKSIQAVLRAPFCAVALILSYLYGYFNPIGGRKLVSAVQRYWNEEVSFDEGFSMLHLFFQKNWKFEGGGGPEGLGRNGGITAPCQQPTHVVISDGKDGYLAYRTNAPWDPRGEVSVAVDLITGLAKTDLPADVLVKTTHLIQNKQILYQELKRREQVQ